MTVEYISWSSSTKECCRPRRGLNPRPPGLQSDGASNWATEADKVSYRPLLSLHTSVVSNDSVSRQWRLSDCALYAQRLFFEWRNPYTDDYLCFLFMKYKFWLLIEMPSWKEYTEYLALTHNLLINTTRDVWYPFKPLLFSEQIHKMTDWIHFSYFPQKTGSLISCKLS